jgi:hypothetical protein
VYPGNPTTPIEWAQYKQMMFETTPDILLIPSDLMLYARVSFLKFDLTFFRMLRDVSASTQGSWLRGNHVAASLALRLISGKDKTLPT